jgi:short subunit dehydrogenase-like uncharacterized protein
MGADRDLDVVVYGATGFVGRLTAEYLARSAPQDVRIGLGGRSRSKLEHARASLGARAADWPLIVADSSDAAAVEELASATRVVATTVGPYAKYGMPLVEACARAGTDYADLTGEVLFIRDTIDRSHDVAKASGARIVHGCGFDSIPGDLGVLLLHEAAGELEETTLVVTALKGAPSGGTIDSVREQVAEMRGNPARAKIAGDPYALSPDRSAEPQLGDESDLRMPEYSAELGRWLGPFVMAAINTRQVRRSNALRSWPYGRRFKYREVMGFPGGLAGRAQATAVALGAGALFAGLSFGPTRSVLDRVLPKPGEGPSEEARRKGFYKVEIHSRTPSGERWVCREVAQGDPGYAATAVMLGESALALALERDRLPDAAGVLTPATAIGSLLADRLRAAGQTWEVERLGAGTATTSKQPVSTG